MKNSMIYISRSLCLLASLSLSLSIQSTGGELELVKGTLPNSQQPWYKTARPRQLRMRIEILEKALKLERKKTKHYKNKARASDTSPKANANAQFEETQEASQQQIIELQTINAGLRDQAQQLVQQINKQATGKAFSSHKDLIAAQQQIADLQSANDALHHQAKQLAQRNKRQANRPSSKIQKEHAQLLAQHASLTQQLEKQTDQIAQGRTLNRLLTEALSENKTLRAQLAEIKITQSSLAQLGPEKILKNDRDLTRNNDKLAMLRQEWKAERVELTDQIRHLKQRIKGAEHQTVQLSQALDAEKSQLATRTTQKNDSTPLQTGKFFASKTQAHTSTFVNEAQRYLEKNNFKKARTSFVKALNQNPDSLIAQIGIASCYYGEGQLNEAKQRARQLQQTHPDNPQILSLLGILAWHDNDYRKATALIKKAIRIDPNEANYYNYLSVVFHARGKDDEAVEMTRRALTLNPNHTDALFNLAVLLATQKSPAIEEAQLYYHAALKSGRKANPTLEKLFANP